MLLLGGCAGAGDGPGGETATMATSTVEASAVPGPAATGDPTVCSGARLTSAALVDTGDALQVRWTSDGTDDGADVLWSVIVSDVAYSQAYQLGVRTGPGGATVYVFDLIETTNTYLTTTPEVDAAGVTALFSWSGLPADTARDRARVVELATTYLHRGWSVRQASDVLDVQTPVLTKWLREAGVHVTRGTLTGEPPTGPTGSSSSTSGATTTTAPGVMVADGAARVAAGAHPVSVLNELVQAGALDPLTWEVQAVTRPGADLVHTAGVTTRVAGTDVEVVGEGTAPAKAGARAAAAADVLARLRGTAPAR
ncbi:hypothetical protein Col01nite_13310 [Cellulomonas oligotrophica]|uniref:DRBM domain-containing protein n=1 Tax=Cellulomonas oligotrophica TaxID=931536 RepID=A0ABQ4D8W1_9CELL|nr:hypothetical protein Col01nite_13310 [Cellulomonas oligotrophica]